MNHELLLRKLRNVRDSIEEDPEEAGNELDELIEELEPEDHSDQV